MLDFFQAIVGLPKLGFKDLLQVSELSAFVLYTLDLTGVVNLCTVCTGSYRSCQSLYWILQELSIFVLDLTGVVNLCTVYTGSYKSCQSLYYIP